MAIDAQGNLYISDGGNNRIRKVSVADGKIRPFAGGGPTVGLNDGSVATTVQFEPGDIAMDNSSSIYFSDNLYNRIRKITNPVVPVVLGYFKVNGTKEGAVASWQTLSEFNTAYFILKAGLGINSFKVVVSVFWQHINIKTVKLFRQCCLLIAKDLLQVENCRQGRLHFILTDNSIEQIGKTRGFCLSQSINIHNPYNRGNQKGSLD